MVVVQMRGGGTVRRGDGWGILCVWEEDMGMTRGKCFPRRRRRRRYCYTGPVVDEEGWDGLG